MKSLTVFAGIVIFMLFSFTSCDLLDVDDPMEPDEEILERLPYTQYLVAFWSGTDQGRFPLQWMQQLSGIRGMHLQVDRYNMSAEFMDPIWNLYYHYINDNIFLTAELAQKVDSRAYRGITRILNAYSLGMMTDAWGDVPYKTYPRYEDQQILIFSILELVQQGIEDIKAAGNGAGMKPGPAEDLIYGGDLDRWERAANLIRLRYLLRSANFSGNYNTLLPYIESYNLMQGNQDNMVFEFPGGDRVNPHYHFDINTNNTRAGKFLVELMKETGDPRLPKYFRTSSHEYIGSEPGQALLTASNIANSFRQELAPIVLLSYAEQKFIEAEVYYRTGNHPAADLAYEEGVRASLLQYDAIDEEWEAEHASIQDVSLEQIITAKYVALFLSPEVWSDYRRTGYPRINPYNHEQDAEAEIPRRFLYPSDEVFFNYDNVPADVDIFTRIWWDAAQ